MMKHLCVCKLLTELQSSQSINARHVNMHTCKTAIIVPVVDHVIDLQEILQNQTLAVCVEIACYLRRVVEDIVEFRHERSLTPQLLL